MSVVITKLKDNITIFNGDINDIDKSIKEYFGDESYIEFSYNNNRIVISKLIGDWKKDWPVIQSFIRDFKLNNVLNER